MKKLNAVLIALSVSFLIFVVVRAVLGTPSQAEAEIARINAELRDSIRQETAFAANASDTISAADTHHRRLVDSAKRRKTLYAELIRKHPEKALELAFEDEHRAQLHPEIQEHIEKPVTIEGTLEIFEVTDHEGDDDGLLHTVRDGDGIRLLVYPVEKPGQHLHSKRVRVEGMGIDHLIVVMAMEPIDDADALEPEEPQLGTKRAAVILVQFEGVSYSPYRLSAEEVRSLVFTGERSVSAFMDEASGGKLGMKGDVLGPYKVRLDEHERNCHDAILASERVNRIARANGVDLEEYTNVIYLMPDATHCKHGWGTIGEVEGLGETWLVGSAAREGWMIAHELGHNLGLSHANAYACPGNEMPERYDDSCGKIAYGDPYDIMGRSQGFRLFNNIFRIRLGWLEPSQVSEATGSGIWTLDATNPRAIGVQAIRVPRVVEGAGDDYYYLEYRQPSGLFDTFAPGATVTQGITIRLGNDGKGISNIIDANGYEQRDLVVRAGEVFSDTPAGIVIAPIALTPEKATIGISAPVPQDR